MEPSLRILGLDEAGRGSVLGPMAVGGFCLDVARLPELVATGVTDSKRLSPRRREALVPVLHTLGEGRVRLIPAAAIDEGNLTDIELDAFTSLILELCPDQVMIDAPVHPRGIPRFLARLRERIPAHVAVVAEPKADLHHVQVGAASVLAKVARDAEIEALGAVGSGYPSDPETRAWIKGFLDRNEPFPACVRARWGTIRELMQTGLFG